MFCPPKARRVAKVFGPARSGFSLLELLFASFLLLTSISLTVYLIDASFRSEADSDLKAQALYDAENVLAEIQAQARQNFRTGIGEVADKVWPTISTDYTLESKVSWHTLPVPCSELESQYSAANDLPRLAQKKLTESVWKVSVVAAKTRGGEPLIELTTLVTDLKPETFELRMLAPDGTTAPSRGELNFRAVAYDSRNNVIKDLIITWYVEPINSFGSIYRVRRDGWDCVYKNLYRDFGNRYISTPGLCRIVARGEYKGGVQYAVKEVTNQ